MKFNFIATLPENDSGRLIMEIPVKANQTEITISRKAKVIINGTTYLCNLFENGKGFYSIHLIKALKKDVGLGNTVEVTLELIEDTKPNIHDAVLQWERNEGKELMNKVGIKDNNNIIDFGCGHGHYTIPCSLAMNNTGKVYAIDYKSAELKWINKKADMLNVSNIETVKTDGSLKMDFPNDSMDAILLYDIIHLGINQNSNQVAIPIRFPLYEEAHRVLKNGGILSVLSFDSEMNVVPDKNMIRKKTTYKELLSEIPGYGFELFNTVENGIHFDWCHIKYQLAKGFEFDELEKGTIYNFIKK